MTATGSGTATGAPPWRPTDVSSTSTSTSTTSAPPVTTAQTGETQTGCPTGFYGCLATHGGGCCRTDRDCQTLSCPAPSSTIISHGVTVVVPANDVPTTTASDECASGWFLCGKDAGSVAGCCPSGYKCGTASCFTSSASQTNSLQKQLPEQEAPNKNAAARATPSHRWLAMGSVAGSLFLLLGIL
ncbi:gpi anchored [Trichoderma arundinaceum]|uniref:Gpi anchored n=1 Tax=Trichoderma arundinaceum TaxID=490622 RepID=A0A395NMZ5_TRIAR|nr:gpi anchored [Trichoderma arundinaceum]